MNKIFRSLTALVLPFLCASSFAAYTKPLLVMDMSNASHLPRNFRTTSDRIPAKEGNINTVGLKELHIGGGSQFSKMAFQKILAKMHQKHILIIDLRQESHGFLNSNAISWYAPNDAINAGKSDAQIEAAQAELLDQLSKQDVADVFDIVKKKNGYVTKVHAKQYAVHQVMSEAQFAESAKQNYARIYVQDTYKPTNDQVDHFIQLIKNTPSHEWIYFHCRAGEGRTTTFMAMYDMMKNAKKVSFDDIIARQAAIGGKDLQSISKKTDKTTRGLERYKFLQQFYDYAKSNEDNFATSWTQWLNEA